MKQETLEEVKNLTHYKSNAEEDYLAVPISVLRYISQLEQEQQTLYNEEEVLELLNKSCDYIYDSSKIGTDKKLMPNLLRGWFEQFKKK